MDGTTNPPWEQLPVMPIITSSFEPSRFLRNGHLQTIIPVLAKRRFATVFRHERMELADGDFLGLDWAISKRERLAILSHGLEGSSKDPCVRGMADRLFERGWDVLAWNYRGCGPEPNRLVRSYHSGETGDLKAIIVVAAASYATIALIGFSLGGNVTLKYLGEGGCHPAVAAGVAISAPIDLESSATEIDRRWGNWFYRRRFLGSLLAKYQAKALRFPDRLNATGSRKVRTLREFDDLYTAPIHGFRDAIDYWKQSSAKQYLHEITVPTLLVNARDDPFLTDDSLPFTEAQENPNLFLEVPASGGHIGFIDSIYNISPWHEQRTVDFLAQLGLTKALQDRR
jgi:predicted alpha/beta-fold hydrolase